MRNQNPDHRVLHAPTWYAATSAATTLVLAALVTTELWAQSSMQVLESRGASIVVTGEQWMSASEDQRRAFLVGIGNMIVAEGAYAKRHDIEMPYVSDQIVKAIAKLKLADIESIITRWYEANPGKQSTPVMGIIWQDIAGHGPEKGKNP